MEGRVNRHNERTLNVLERICSGPSATGNQWVGQQNTQLSRVLLAAGETVCTNGTCPLEFAPSKQDEAPAQPGRTWRQCLNATCPDRLDSAAYYRWLTGICQPNFFYDDALRKPLTKCWPTADHFRPDSIVVASLKLQDLLSKFRIAWKLSFFNPWKVTVRGIRIAICILVFDKSKEMR